MDGGAVQRFFFNIFYSEVEVYICFTYSILVQVELEIYKVETNKEGAPPSRFNLLPFTQKGSRC